jgi:hypothetical protein
MIMQRTDNDDDFFEPLPGFIDTGSETLDLFDAPGFMYRGVPQNPQRRTLRIDSIRTPVMPLSGPSWIVEKRQQRELSVSELYFG